MSYSSNKVKGFAHPFVLIALLMVLLAVGAVYFMQNNKQKAELDNPIVAGTSSPQESFQLIKNSMFNLEATESDEIAKFWQFFPGYIGNVTAEIDRAKSTNLAKAEVVKINVSNKPLITQPHIQQKSVKIKPNSKYRITFAARSTSEGSIMIVVKDMSILKRQIAPTQTITLQPNMWAQYGANFTTGQFSSSDGTIVNIYFDLPSQADASIDNILLRKTGNSQGEPDADNDGVPDSIDECPNVHQGSNPDPDRPGCTLQES
nr:hypothetical protein [Patescibacteria group bacterium]